MGDIADSMIDSMIEYMWFGSKPRVPRKHTCKFCRKTGLLWTWHKKDKRWLLGDGKEIHMCKVNPYKGRIKNGGLL